MLDLNYLGLWQHGREARMSATKLLKMNQGNYKQPNPTKFLQIEMSQKVF